MKNTDDTMPRMLNTFDALPLDFQVQERKIFESRYKWLMHSGRLGDVTEVEFTPLFSGSYPHRRLNSYWTGWRESVMQGPLPKGVIRSLDDERIQFISVFKEMIKAGRFVGIPDSAFIPLSDGNFADAYVGDYWLGWRARAELSGRIASVKMTALQDPPNPRKNDSERKAFEGSIDSAMERTGRPGAQIVREIELDEKKANYESRIEYLEKLVGIYGPKSLQYDIEHPNDGLNSADPAEVLRVQRGRPAERDSSNASIDKPEFWDVVFKFYKETPSARESRRALINYIHAWAVRNAPLNVIGGEPVGMTRSTIFELLNAAAEACDDHNLPLNAADLRQIAKLFEDETPQSDVAGG
jgi:hypothetical protein